METMDKARSLEGRLDRLEARLNNMASTLEMIADRLGADAASPDKRVEAVDILISTEDDFSVQVEDYAPRTERAFEPNQWPAGEVEPQEPPGNTTAGPTLTDEPAPENPLDPCPDGEAGGPPVEPPTTVDREMVGGGQGTVESREGSATVDTPAAVPVKDAVDATAQLPTGARSGNTQNRKEDSSSDKGDIKLPTDKLQGQSQTGLEAPTAANPDNGEAPEGERSNVVDFPAPADDPPGADEVAAIECPPLVHALEEDAPEAEAEEAGSAENAVPGEYPRAASGGHGGPGAGLPGWMLRESDDFIDYASLRLEGEPLD